MTPDRNRNYPEPDRSLMVRGDDDRYLPSTEVREVVPGFNDEIDLRDYLDMLIRRKTALLSVLAVVFLLVALNTFLATPQFKAKGGHTKAKIRHYAHGRQPAHEMSRLCADYALTVSYAF